ncbi:cytochrome c [Massilia sp. 9096]|uniref:cytochrome c n=1 Tax=Massilia sp. 9096 TaxID=1500894 RepID=UPI0012E07F13|nr:c-type cytochrome [Massilia sp. 9096]
MKRIAMTAAALALVFGASASRAADVAAGADPQLVQRGAYLARAGDCIACHTTAGGKPFAGGLALATPIGTVYSSNITPDKAHGIGDYTLADFDQALRHGVRKDGVSLYPAMPYPSYAKLQPADVQALYAYFMHGVAAQPTPNRAVGIPWPLSMRWPLRVWRAKFAPAVAPSAPQPAAADQVARGRYLVEGLGHCGACHTPRGVTLQEKSLTDSSSDFLAGAIVDGYLANNLRGDVRDGLGAWSEQDIVQFLKSGRNGHSAAFGGMADVVANSTQHLSDADLHAIASYLKTLKPVQAGQTAPAYSNATYQALRTGADKSEGALDFLNNCAACHRTSGKGYKETFPTLALSPTVNANDPSSLISIVLQGGAMPGTTTAPTEFAMPAFGARLSDAEVASVLTFVRGSWGNHAPAVTASMVAKIRKALPKKTADGATPEPQR